ncbi:MAG TPA: choice-of-anchor D domain-containing protein, partial [Armatimonadota bacterium]
SGVPSPRWSSPQGGDGWDVAYDGVTPGRVYGTSGFWPAPCTRVFVSTVDGTDFPPTVPSAQDITPWGTTSDQACGVFPITTDPSTAGIVYVSGNQNLWQSRNAGGTWRIIGTFGSTGNSEVARTNGNNVVIGVGNQVFVSTNALAATVGPPTGVTFTNITRNLPSRNVQRVVFDPNDPTVIYAVLGGFNAGPGQTGHVFRTTIGATFWTDISPALDVPFGAIALDGAETPTAIYAGTDLGVLRSVDDGASWTVLDDIHFPHAPVTDLVLNPAARVLRAATYGRGIFQFAKPAGPAIALSLEQDLAFGTVCQGPQFLELEVINVGVADMVINSVHRLMGSPRFTVLSTPVTPLVIAAGESVDFRIRYDPLVAGALDVATIRIASNDPNAPFVDVSVTGRLGTASMATVIADSGSFGNVCLGTFVDRELTINNTGQCPLRVLNVSSTSAEFLVPAVISYPLVVGPGDSLALPIRFQPVSLGGKLANITLTSNDPAGVRTVTVSGVAPAPRLNLMIADSGNFGNVCVGSFVDMPLTVFNSGECALSVTNIASSASEFLVPNGLTYPIRIAPGVSIEIPIRFQPASFGAKSATITVTSDDPAGARSVSVSGNAPSGKLAVTGSTCFGGVKACCRAERSISICNVGDCDLHVTSVAFKRKSHHWKLINNPFPATLHPGSCLCVVIRYKATEKCPRSCELVIMSDDPHTPVKTLDVLAYTLWDDCDDRKDCDDCRKEHCEKHHSERRCDECDDDCCDDDDDDDHEDRDEDEDE